MSEQSLAEIRLSKLDRMRALGHDPYAIERFSATDSAKRLLERYEELEGRTVAFAGRLVSYRDQGKTIFGHLSDGDGRIQIFVKEEGVGAVGWELAHLLDLGDHVAVRGELFTTKTGEKTIRASEIMPLSKALRTVPVTYYGLEDVDTRYRHRHLDLIANAESRQRLLDRSRIVSSVRRYFDDAGYFEVETPFLQTEAGGAAARPFNTFYNHYEMPMKLRISLELYLKRLICGDIPKVYEIGRVFRNEKVSNRHNPEFTMIEFYEAYANLEDMMTRVEELFRYVALRVYGSTVVEVPERPSNDGKTLPGYRIDFGPDWHRVDFREAVVRYVAPFRPLAFEDLSSLERIKAVMGPEAIVNPNGGGEFYAPKEDSLGGCLEKLLEVFVEPELQEPSFVIGYPIETSPLAKKKPDEPHMTRRFEGYVLGREICNAFSEINDPVDQRQRFEAQLERKATGDDEAHPMDEDFLFALECGMPPTGGCGIGIDRMAMLLTGADHIRQTLLFPTMKPVL